MRIHLKLTKNLEPVPFTYQEQMTELIHKWTEDYEYPGKVSLHSFSSLRRGRKIDDALSFENGSSFFISSWDNDFLRKIIESLNDNSDFSFGMNVYEIVIQETPDLSSIDFFRLASPVLICRMIDSKKEYFFHDDPQAGVLLAETIHTKMKSAGLETDESLSIVFNNACFRGKKKRVNYKGVSNPVSINPLIIKSKNETKQFIWNVGLGNSTGIGFGAIV